MRPALSVYEDEEGLARGGAGLFVGSCAAALKDRGILRISAGGG